MENTEKYTKERIKNYTSSIRANIIVINEAVKHYGYTTDQIKRIDAHLKNIEYCVFEIKKLNHSSKINF